MTPPGSTAAARPRGSSASASRRTTRSRRLFNGHGRATPSSTGSSCSACSASASRSSCGVGMRIGTAAGALMYAFMYAASLPLENNPIVDDHLIGVIVMVVLGLRPPRAPPGASVALWRRSAWSQKLPRPASDAEQHPHRTRPGDRAGLVASRRGSVERDAPDERRAAPGRPAAARASRPDRRRAGARCAARSRAGRPGIPMPSSATVSTSSWALTSTSTSARSRRGRAGRRWRWPRAAPAAAGRATWPGTAVSIGPMVRTAGLKPSTGTYSRTRVRISGRSEERCLFWSSKIVPRIALIVSSSVGDRLVEPARDLGRRTPSRPRPGAAARWRRAAG